MKYNFTKVKYKNIEGNDYPQAEKDIILKVLGNEIARVSTDIGLSDIARAIYKGEEIEIDNNRIENIKNIITGNVQSQDGSTQPRFNIFIREGLTDYITKKKEEKK